MHTDGELPKVSYDTPMISASNADLRDMIRYVIQAWARHNPHEVSAAKAYLAQKKAAQSDRTGRTGLGEHVIGAFPAKVSMAMTLALGDADWMHNNPAALGILFDEFQIGRLAEWTGTGREGAGSHSLTLNEADKA